MPSTATDPHQPLRDDVHLLGDLLGATLRAHAGDDLFQVVEQVRRLARAARAGNVDAWTRAQALLGALPLGTAIPVARAFTQFLQLANVAEQHHRTRRRRDYLRNPEAGAQPGSCAEAFVRLLGTGITAAELHEAVQRLRIDLVLTAHPTEVSRRTLLRKYGRIARLLARRDRPDLTRSEQDACHRGIAREVAAIWASDEVRHAHVTPLDEVRAGLVVFEESLWHAVPRYLA
ncbi:MAG: phosphoenolpyruvate carboxylase, partial [Vicinamibacterales bacterium]